jgi:hypothetical protein
VQKLANIPPYVLKDPVSRNQPLTDGTVPVILGFSRSQWLFPVRTDFGLAGRDVNAAELAFAERNLLFNDNRVLLDQNTMIGTAKMME